jgi:hypothetical protein
MSLTTRVIPSLLNGVSRQPAILRSHDQTDDEVNTWGNFALGLGRRPPTIHVASLDVENIEDAFIHHINRDSEERYIVTIEGGEIKVFDAATGEEKTVATPYGTTYLDGTKGAFKAVTVADYTFIVNSSITPALGAVAADHGAPPNYYVPGGRDAWGRLVGA